MLIYVATLRHWRSPTFSKCIVTFESISMSLSFLSIPSSARPSLLAFSPFCADAAKPKAKLFLHPSVAPNLPSRLTPLSAGPPLQSYKYGRIKVKIFSISVLHRRRKCHPCCIWDLEKLGNELRVRSAGRGCACMRAQTSVFLRAHTICCPPTNGKIIFAANSPQVITTSQTQYWIIPISL